MVGLPCAGKAMLAARLTIIVPELSPAKALEIFMMHSLVGLKESNGVNRYRTFREPHHIA